MRGTMRTLASASLLVVDCLHATASIVDEGYPLIRTPNIGKGRLDLNGVQRVTEAVYEKWTRRAVPQDGDLILAREAPAGNVAIVKHGDKVCLGQRTVLIRPDPEQIDPDFLCYFLLAPRQQAFLLARSTGATAPHVNMKDIRRLPFNEIPNLDTQHWIGGILSAYDDLIENNRRRMALLEEAARKLYREWFVCLRFPGHENTPIQDGLPEGWGRKTLDDICEAIREIASPDQVDAETPYIGLEHIPRRSISQTEWGSAEEVTSSKHKFGAGDILFGKIRPYFHKVSLAFVDGVASADAIVIRPKEADLHSLVLLTVSSDAFVAMASQTMREGSKMPRADWKQMQAYEVLQPSRQVLKAFNRQIIPITQQLRNLTFQSRKLRTARDRLLPKLMSGEIEV